MSQKLTPEYLQVGNRLFGSLPSTVQRISIPVTVGTKFDLIITMTGSNWSLGTTDKRYLRALVTRRYNGSINVLELEGSGARFVSTFGSAGVGVIIETSTATSCIVQLHNSYSNGPNSGLTIEYEMVSSGLTPTTVQQYTGGNYTSNNIF